MPPAKNIQPKRHHFVPKFCLRRFADHKRRVRMYRRGTKESPRLASINNAAVESGFYTIEEKSGERTAKVEQLLSMIEGLAQEAIVRIASGQFPPTSEDRTNLSIFMAFQILRTPEHRRGYEVMVDKSQKDLWKDGHASTLPNDCRRRESILPKKLLMR
jgi:hypothetical protein